MRLILYLVSGFGKYINAQLFISLVELAEKVDRVDFKYAANRVTTKRDAAKILNAIKERMAP